MANRPLLQLEDSIDRFLPSILTLSTESSMEIQTSLSLLLCFHMFVCRPSIHGTCQRLSLSPSVSAWKPLNARNHRASAPASSFPSLSRADQPRNVTCPVAWMFDPLVRPTNLPLVIILLLNVGLQQVILVNCLINQKKILSCLIVPVPWRESNLVSS